VDTAILCLSEDREPDNFFETFNGVCEVADVSDWLPRPVPAPPKEEESELVKRFREIKVDLIRPVDAINIVKEFEKGGKK
jgi:hypothetical protein